MLLGMGKDGHIGSLYPERKEVQFTGTDKWVLPVDKVGSCCGHTEAFCCPT
jgi:6-phosphogluconolactonase/glucosamine-6-phosphate isomerase/deaminase